MLKEIKRALTEWKSISWSWIRGLSIIKVVSLQIDLQVQCTLYQNPNCLSLGRTDKLILKFTWEFKEPWIVKKILRKNSKVKRFLLPNFKLYYKAIITKTLRYWHKAGHTDQWNRIESTGLNLFIYCLIYLSVSGNRHAGS